MGVGKNAEIFENGLKDLFSKSSTVKKEGV
jgi:hypothetical protein